MENFEPPNLCPQMDLITEYITQYDIECLKDLQKQVKTRISTIERKQFAEGITNGFNEMKSIGKDGVNKMKSMGNDGYKIAKTSIEHGAVVAATHETKIMAGVAFILIVMSIAVTSKSIHNYNKKAEKGEASEDMETENNLNIALLVMTILTFAFFMMRLYYWSTAKPDGSQLTDNLPSSEGVVEAYI